MRSLLLVLLLILAGCGGGESPAATGALPPATAMAGVTVETGGMVLPAAPAADSPAAGAPAADQLPAAAATTSPVLPVGSVLTTTAAATLYAAPDLTALRFAQYAAGSLLTVIEPDGDWTAYPVEVAGQRWLRVRAEDGLAGWVME